MDKHVNLLYVQNDDDDDMRHFAWIKNLSRLVSSQLSKHKIFLRPVYISTYKFNKNCKIFYNSSRE